MIEDIRANKGNVKGQLFLISFRLAQSIRNTIFIYLLFPIPVVHVVVFNWLMGFDIPLRTSIGKGARIFHGNGLVINADVEVGDYCTLRHSTTIGNVIDKNGVDSKSPIIGNNCELGAHVIILGNVHIGDNVTIGAGSIVLKDVPSNSVAYGNPLKIKSKSK